MLVFIKSDSNLITTRKIRKTAMLLLKSSSLLSNVHGAYGALQGKITSDEGPALDIEPGAVTHAQTLAKVGSLEPTRKSKDTSLPIPSMIMNGDTVNPHGLRTEGPVHDPQSSVATHRGTDVTLSSGSETAGSEADYSRADIRAKITGERVISPPVGLPESVWEKHRLAKTTVDAHPDSTQQETVRIAQVGGSALIERGQGRPLGDSMLKGTRNFIPIVSLLKNSILRAIRIIAGTGGVLKATVDEKSLPHPETEEIATEYADTLTDPKVLETIGPFLNNGLRKNMINLHRAVPRLGIFLSHGILHQDSLKVPSANQDEKLPIEMDSSSKRQQFRKEANSIKSKFKAIFAELSEDSQAVFLKLQEEEPDIENGAKYAFRVKSAEARKLIAELRYAGEKISNPDEKTMFVKLLRDLKKSQMKYSRSVGQLVGFDTPDSDVMGRTFVSMPFEEALPGTELHSTGFSSPTKVSGNWMNTVLNSITRSGLSNNELFKKELRPFFEQWMKDPLAGTELINGSLQIKKSLKDAWAQLSNDDKKKIQQAFRSPSGRPSFFGYARDKNGKTNETWINGNAAWSHNRDFMMPLVMTEDQNFEMNEEKAKDANIGTQGWQNFKKIYKLVRRQLQFPGRLETIDPYSGSLAKITTGGSNTVASNDMIHIPTDGQETVNESGYESKAHLELARREGDPETMPLAQHQGSGGQSQPLSVDLSKTKSLLFKLFPRRQSVKSKDATDTNGTMLGQINFDEEFTSCHIAVFHEVEKGNIVKIGQIKVNVPEGFYDPSVINKQNKENLQDRELMQDASTDEKVFGRAKVDSATGDIVGIPSDEQFIKAIGYLRSTSTTLTPETLDVAKKTVNAWHKSNDDGSYCILMGRNPNLFNLDEDAEYKERARARYFIRSADRVAEISKNEDISNNIGSYFGLDGVGHLSHIQSMDVIEKIIASGKTRQDNIVDQQRIINAQNLTNDESQKTIKYQGLYNFARSLVEDQMAQHAAFEHLNAAMALHRSDTPLMRDSETGELVDDPQRIEQGPNYNPYGLLVGLVGSAYNPQVIANQANVSRVGTVMPNNIPPELALSLLARRYGPAQNGTQVTPSTPWTQKLQWNISINSPSNSSHATANIENMGSSPTVTVGDEKTEEFSNKPTLAEGWGFPLCLNEDNHGSLFFFGNENPETNPVINKQDLLNLVATKILSMDNILLARKAKSRDDSIEIDENAAGVFMKKLDGETPAAKFNSNKTSIIINGFGFLGKYDNPISRLNFATQSNGTMEIPIVSQTDSNNITTYHLDMTPIRKQAQILTHAMQEDSTLQTQSEQLLKDFNASTSEPVFQAILGDSYAAVKELSLTRHRDGITSLDQIAQHGGVAHRSTSKESIESFQQQTGWTIDPNIRQWFEKDRRTEQGSDDMRIVAIRGSVAIIAIPTAQQRPEHPSDVDAYLDLKTYLDKVMTKEDKEHSERQFGRIFGPLEYGKIKWDQFDRKSAGEPDFPSEGEEDESQLYPRSDGSYFFKDIALGSSPRSDGKPGNYEKFQELLAQPDETVAVPLQFLIVDLRNANGIFEKPEDGKPLGVGTSVKINQGDVTDGSNKKVTTGSKTQQAQQDFERWQQAKTINDAENVLAKLFQQTDRPYFNSLLTGIGEARLDEIINGAYSEDQKKAAEILKANIGKKENDFPENANRRTRHIDENFVQSQKNLDIIRKEGYQDTFYPISAENVLFKVSPQQFNSSYVDAIDQIGKIADTISEGTIGRNLIEQKPQIEQWASSAVGNLAESLGIVQLALGKTEQAHTERESNQDPVQSIATDGIPSNLKTEFYIKENVFVLPNFSSINGKAKGLPNASMSAQDIRKSIGNFSTDLVKTLEKLGIKIVIHSGNRESIESLDPSIKANRTGMVNGKNTTWTTKDNTIFLGTRSENPMQDLLRHVANIYAGKIMNDSAERSQAKNSLDVLLSATGNSPLEKHANDSLKYDPTNKSSEDDAIREYLKIVFQNKFSHNGKYHNFGGFLKEHEFLSKVNHMSDDLSEPVSVADDTGIRTAPAMPVTSQMDRLRNILFGTLNKKQRLGMEGEGPLIIEGIPGAGKTKMLIDRMIDLTVTRKIDPRKILACTFTVASAQNLEKKYDQEKSRVTGVLGTPIKDFTDDTTAIPHIGTMHSVAFNWINKQDGKDPVLKIEGFNWENGKFKKVKVLDENQSTNMIKGIMDGLTESERQELDEDGKKWTAKTVSSKLAKLKDSEQSVHDDPSVLLRKVSSMYEEELKRRKLTDFSGLLNKIADHLASSKDARTMMQQKYSHVMVDEFQDTNNVQMRILKAITPSDGGHLTVVGDKMQAIYGFRGGNTKFIDRDFFSRLYPKAKFINLDQNYRSSQEILATAGAVEEGAGIQRTMINNATRAQGQAFPGTPLANLGINRATVPNPPVEIFKASGTSPIKKQLEYIGSQIRALTGVSRGKIAEQTGINAIAILCRTTQEVEAVTKHLTASGITVKPKKKEPTLEEQISGQKPYGADIETEKEQPGIVVTTVHQSKGLEYPAVFIYNASVSSFPTSRSMRGSWKNPEERKEAFDEERRLFYTAATRAMRKLFILSNKKGTSPFVKEIEQNLQRRRGIINVSE